MRSACTARAAAESPSARSADGSTRYHRGDVGPRSRASASWAAICRRLHRRMLVGCRARPTRSGFIFTRLRRPAAGGRPDRRARGEVAAISRSATSERERHQERAATSQVLAAPRHRHSTCMENPSHIRCRFMVGDPVLPANGRATSCCAISMIYVQPINYPIGFSRGTARALAKISTPSPLHSDRNCTGSFGEFRRTTSRSGRHRGYQARSQQA